MRPDGLEEYPQRGQTLPRVYFTVIHTLRLGTSPLAALPPCFQDGDEDASPIILPIPASRPVHLPKGSDQHPSARLTKLVTGSYVPSLHLIFDHNFFARQPDTHGLENIPPTC